MPTIPLDVWISISEKLPWEGPIKIIYRNTLKELPCADPKVVLFSTLSAIAHEIDGEVLGVLGNMAKVSINLGVIGPPGSGKTTIPVFILSKLGIKRVGSRSSPEGIGRILSEEGGVVHFCDEVQQIFRGRKKDEYVGALVDLWKSSFIKAPLSMARRSSKKSIDIPSNAKLTVIWTSTEDDLEKISEMIDTALLRRFLILRTEAEVDPLKTGEEVSWDEARACIRFIESFKWRFHPEINDVVLKFRDSIIDLFEDKQLTKMMLSEYGVRISCVLAIDRMISDLLKAVRKALDKAVFITVDGIYGQLLQQINTTLVGLQHTSDHASVEAVEDQTPDLEKNRSEFCSFDEVIFNASVTGRSEVLLKSVETVLSLLLKYLLKYFMKKSGSVDDHVMISELIGFMERSFWRTPKLSSENMNVIDVWVPSEYVALGITLTALALLDTSEFVKWFGWDEDWLYFVRRCYELSRKFGEFNIRTMAMYMRRISRYSLIKEFLERALDAGYLEITKCEDTKEISKCWFRVVS